MSISMSIISRNRIVLILILALVIRLAVAWQPVETLIPKILLDDAFLGYSIARNIAIGNGITYNGIDKTNGMQPLWIFLITPVYWITSDIYLAVNIILSIIAVIDTLVVLMIYKLAKRYFGETIALLSALLWAVNPIIIFQTMNGIETSMYILMILATLFYYDRIKDRINFKNLSVLGILVGLTVLSRGDGIFLALILYVHIWWLNKSANGNHVFFFPIIPILIVFPWLAFSYSTFGTLTPSSFLANFYAAHGLIPFYDLTAPTTFSEILARIGEATLRTFGALAHQMGVIDLTSITLGTALIIPFIILTIYAFIKNFRKMLIPIIFSILVLIFYAGIFWMINIRYLTPVMPFVIILEAVGIIQGFGKIKMFESKRSSSLTAFGLAMIFLFGTLLYNGSVQWNKGYIPWDYQIYQDALWVKENTPQDAIIASFAGGNILYFSNRTVLVADGVVDFNAIGHILNKDVYAYWKSRNVSYWVEQSYNNQTFIDLRQNMQFDINIDNQWYNVFGIENESYYDRTQKLELIKNRCSVYSHMRGFNMLICFFTMRVN